MTDERNPLSEEPYAACRERLTWAESKRKQIAESWNSFVDAESFRAHAVINDVGVGRLSVEQITPVPSDVPILIGEFLYHLRAALDSAVYEAARIQSGKDTPDAARDLEFPICTSEKSFKSSQRKLNGITAEQKKLVENLQPFNAPADLEPKYVPLNFNRALLILNDWARRDRHRRLHVVGSWASNIAPMLEIPAGTRVVELVIPRKNFLLEEFAEIATFRIDGWHRGMKLRANPNLTIEIAVAEDPLPCHPTDTLERRAVCMMKAVEVVVQSFSTMP